MHAPRGAHKAKQPFGGLHSAVLENKRIIADAAQQAILAEITDVPSMLVLHVKTPCISCWLPETRFMA